MLSVPRNQIRDIRAVLRKLILMGPGQPTLVTFRSEGESLLVEAHAEGVLARQRSRCSADSEPIFVPLTALADCEGKDNSLVELAMIEINQVRVSWTHSGVPQSRDYPVKPEAKEFPEEPSTWTMMPPRFLEALKNASEIAGKENTRYAVTRLQLKGGTGEIVATDTCQLLVEGDFALPWKEDVLITKSPLFARKEFASGVVKLARTEGHVWFRMGDWTFAFTIDTEARFPDVSAIIPKISSSSTTVTLNATHRQTITERLDALPAAKENSRPVTLDVNGHVSIRSREAGQPATGMILAGAGISGPPIMAAMDRNYLSTAARLGFERLQLTASEKPLLAVSADMKRKFLWMPLAKDSIVLPSPEDRRVETEPLRKEKSEPVPKPEPVIVPPVQAARKRKTETPTGSTTDSLIDEVTAIQTGLRDLLVRVRNLSQQIRRQRQQQRLMRATLASLKQLQPLT